MKKTGKTRVSLIVPAYNEEKCLPGFLHSLIPAIDDSTISEVIIVNDGSTDSTSEIMRSFASHHPEARTIDVPDNRGKGNALAEGVLLATEEIVLFLDADLVNLTKTDIKAIVKPLIDGTAQVSIACIKSNVSPGNTLPIISGQRAYFRRDILPYLDAFRPLGYGIETFLRKTFPDLTTEKIPLSKVSYISKREKRGNIQGLYEHAMMWSEVVNGALKKKVRQTGEEKTARNV